MPLSNLNKQMKQLRIIDENVYPSPCINGGLDDLVTVLNRIVVSDRLSTTLLDLFHDLLMSKSEKGSIESSLN